MFKISNTEFKVLKIICNKKTSSSKEIHNELKENWTINTTRTLIARLLNKRIIEIVDKKGQSYIYQSKIDIEKYQYLKTKKLLDELFNNNINELINNYNKFEDIEK